MNTHRRWRDQLGRTTGVGWAALAALAALITITGSAWANQARSIRPVLDVQHSTSFLGYSLGFCERHGTGVRVVRGSFLVKLEGVGSVCGEETQLRVNGPVELIKRLKHGVMDVAETLESRGVSPAYSVRVLLGRKQARKVTGPVHEMF